MPYTGETNDRGKPHGLGLREGITHYEGQWENGKRHGHGVMIYPNPSRTSSITAAEAAARQSYQDMWRHDFSAASFDFDKNRIDASFEKAIKEAAIAMEEARVARELAEQARLIGYPPNVDSSLLESIIQDYQSKVHEGRYEGQHFCGKQHGHGVMIYRFLKPSGWPWLDLRPPNWPWDAVPPEEPWDGGRYVGQWRNGMRYGHGVHKCANGGRYVGQWRNDMRHGHGVYVDANGNHHEVEFYDDEPLIG